MSEAPIKERALDALRGRRRTFALEYVSNGGNGAKAARAAGYAADSSNVTGAQLLAIPSVLAAVRELREEVAQAHIMGAAETIAELSKVGRFNIGKALHHGFDGNPVLDLTRFDEHELAALAAIETTTRRRIVGEGENEAIIEDVKVTIKAHSKNDALKTLAKHHKLLTDRVEMGMSEDFAELMDAAIKRSET